MSKTDLFNRPRELKKERTTNVKVVKRKKKKRKLMAGKNMEKPTNN